MSEENNDCVSDEEVEELTSALGQMQLVSLLILISTERGVKRLEKSASKKLEEIHSFLHSL